MTAELTDLLSPKFGNQIKFTPLNSGTRKKVYLAETPQTKFIVLVDSKKSIAVQYRSLRSNYIQKFLFQNGLEVADVLYLTTTADGRIVACHTYIDGHQITKMNKKSAFKLGQTLAKLHSVTFNNQLDHPSYPTKYKLYHILKSQISLFRRLKNSLSKKVWHRLPRGICHYDPNLSNFIFSDDRVFIIDFDRCRYWPFVYELKRFINTKQNKLFATQIINGYQTVRPLTADEKRVLDY